MAFITMASKNAEIKDKQDTKKKAVNVSRSVSGGSISAVTVEFTKWIV